MIRAARTARWDHGWIGGDRKSTVDLQNNVPNVSSIGLGCASAWGQPWFDESKAIAIVKRALELGVTVFDTGPSYSGGHAEPRLGKALRGNGNERLLVSTKVGTHIGKNGKLFHDLSRGAVLHSVEESRRRLGMATIPLLYLHGPQLNELDDGLFDLLLELRERGWVQRLGVNSFDTDVLKRVADISVFDTVMLDYNILRLSREPLIEQLSSLGKTVIAGSALANHLHSPRFLLPSSKVAVWYLLRAVKNYRTDYMRARKFAFLGKIDGWSPAQAALAFVISNPRVSAAMFSTTSLNHLEQNLAVLGRALPDLIGKQIRAASAH